MLFEGNFGLFGGFMSYKNGYTQ